MLDYGSFRTRDYKTTQEFLDAKYKHLESFIGHVGKMHLWNIQSILIMGLTLKIILFHYNLTILDVSIVRIGNNVVWSQCIYPYPNTPSGSHFAL